MADEMIEQSPAQKQFKSPPIHRTALYRAKAAYAGMLARCENANGKNPTYASVKLKMTLSEWLKWALPHYEKFNMEHPNDSPSAARFGDKGDYEIGNIEIIPFIQNRRAQEAPCQLMNGMKLCGRCHISKPAPSFAKNRSYPDGLARWCRQCFKEHRQSLDA